jgi:hypothetical protein
VRTRPTRDGMTDVRTCAHPEDALELDPAGVAWCPWCTIEALLSAVARRSTWQLSADTGVRHSTMRRWLHNFEKTGAIRQAGTVLVLVGEDAAPVPLWELSRRK